MFTATSLCTRALKLALLAAPLVYAGCGEEDRLAGTNPFLPYEDSNVTVIGGSPDVPVASGELNGDGCLEVTADSCVPVNRTGTYCRETSGPADAVVVNGQVAIVVCYADEAQKGPVDVIDTNSDGNIDIPQQENGAVITFDPSTDGKPFNGNVTIDGNNVTLYGNGPDKSIINGNLTIDGNNARVRGIRVKGNVEIKSNTVALLFTIVEGNLHVPMNNVLVAETQVFGNFESAGNNEIFAGNGTGGNWHVTGSGDQCERNYAFDDGNDDLNVQAEERGAALACP